MRNPFYALDDIIMYGVNKGVKAANWVTGLSRTEQAQLVSTGSYMYQSIAEFGMGEKIMGVLSIGVGALYYRWHGSEKKREEKELNAIRDGVKIDNKIRNFTFGCVQYLFLAMSLNEPGAHPENPSMENLHAYGSMAVSLSFAIQRADPIEPRKNCLARGWEHLKAYSATPATEMN